MATITDPIYDVSITPDLIEVYQSARESFNIVHHVLGSPWPAITLGGSGMRTGSLVLFFETEDASSTAEQGLMLDTTFALAVDELPSVDMNFVVTNGPGREYNTEEQRWTVTVDYQELG